LSERRTILGAGLLAGAIGLALLLRRRERAY
jgi:hypothetical protein